MRVRFDAVHKCQMSHILPQPPVLIIAIGGAEEEGTTKRGTAALLLSDAGCSLHRTPIAQTSSTMSLGEPKIKVGDTFPDVTVHIGFAGNTPTAPQSTSSLVSGKKVLVVRHTAPRLTQIYLCTPKRARARVRLLTKGILRFAVDRSRCRARSRPPDPRARCRASRLPRSTAALRRPASTWCTSCA